MKKTLFSVLRTMCVGAMTLFAVSCYDDSALWGEVDRLDGRIDSLASALNSQVEAINSKIGAVEEAYKAADADILAKLQAGDSELAASLTALTTKLDGVDGRVDGYIESNDAALKAAAEEYQNALKALEGKLTDADKALAEADAEILVKLASVGIVKVEKKNGNAVLTFTDGTTLEVPSQPETGIVTVVEVEGVKYWAVVVNGEAKSLEVPVGHNDLQFQVSDSEELEYSVDGGATWTGTGAYVSTSQQIKIDFYQGEGLNYETWEYEYDDFYTLVFGEETYYLPLYKVDNSVASLKAGKTYFQYGETKTIDVVLADVTSCYLMNKPDGWKANYAGKVLTVTAPAEDAVKAGTADAAGEVLLHCSTAEGNCKVARLAVATTPGFSLSVDEEGNVIIINPEVTTVTNAMTGMTITDFNDAYVGLAPVAAFEADPTAYVADSPNNYNDPVFMLSGWKNNTMDWDTGEFTIGGKYDSETYQIDTVVSTVNDMHNYIAYSDVQAGSRFVVWACPIDENGAPRTEDVVYGYYTKRVTANITAVEGGTTTSDIEVTVEVDGAETYYVGLVTEEMLYGFPLDTYMQMQEGPFGYFQMALEYGMEDYAFQMMGMPFGGEFGMEMPETLLASEIMGGALMPEMKVYMWVFPVVDGLALADYTYEENLKPYIYEFKSAPLQAGGTETVSFEEVEKEFTDVTVEIAASDKVSMVYYKFYDVDAFEALEDLTADLLANGNVATYLPTDVRAANDVDELAAGTDVVLAALAVDLDGKYGEPVNEDFKTKELVYSTTFTAAFGEETSSIYSAGFRYDFPITVTGGTAAKYYYVLSTEEYADEDLEYLPLTYDYNYYFRSTTSVSEGMLKGQYVNAESTYYLAVVVESTTGELAPVIKKTIVVPAQPATEE